MVMGKIINQSELIYDACCPEVPAPEYKCFAVITNVAITETFDLIVTTNGSQAGAQAGSVVRVGVTSANLGTTYYAAWEPCGLNTFTLLFDDIGAWLMEGDMQIIVQVSTDEGETICDEFTSYNWYTSFDIQQSEGARSLEFQQYLTPEFECTGTVTHEIIYFNGQVFNPNQLSISESGNGYLVMTGEMFEDKTMVCIVAFYCDGAFQGWLTCTGKPMMFNVRLEMETAACSDDKLNVEIRLTNVGDNAIPASSEFTWTAVTSPDLGAPTLASPQPYVFDNPLNPNSYIILEFHYDNVGCGANELTFTIHDIPAGLANFTPEELEIVIGIG